MPQINFSIKPDFDKQIQKVSNILGIAKSDYIKSLITEDLKKFITNEKWKK